MPLSDTRNGEGFAFVVIRYLTSRRGTTQCSPHSPANG